MAIRKDIVFTVAADGRSVTPTVPQDGGVQGEHNATRVIFHVGENSVWENPDYTVYIECEDNAGNPDTTEPLAVEGGQVAVLLPKAWTQYGGISTLRLVAEGADGTIAYMAEGAVRFTSRQNASQKVDGLLKGRMAEMEKRANDALSGAEGAMSTAQESVKQAEGYARSCFTNSYNAEQYSKKSENAASAAADAAEEAAASAAQAQYDKTYIGDAAKFAGAARDEALAAKKQAEDAAQQASVSEESAKESEEYAATAVMQCSKYVLRAESAAKSAENAAASGGGDIIEYNRVSVRNYGAVGDGVADDRAAIIAAFEAAKSMLPCEVYFPAGTYGISNGITVDMAYGTGGLLVRGAGRDVTQIKYLDSYDPDQLGNMWYAIRIWPVGMPDNKPPTDGDYLHDISITGLGVYDPDPCAHAWHPSKGDPNKEETHGFDLQYIKRVSVTDCNLLYVGDEAIDICGCYDVIVMNNHVEGCPAAGTAGGAISIGDGCKGVVVSGNTVNGSAPDETLDDGTIIKKNNFGIAVESLFIPVEDVTITGNVVTNIQGHGINLGATNAGSGLTNIIISNNVIDNCRIGIDDEGTYPKSGIVICDNIIANTRTDGGGYGHAIRFNTGLVDVVVTGNTIKNIAAEWAIRAVEGNSTQVYADNLIDGTDDAVYFGSGDITIKDCIIKNTGRVTRGTTGAIVCTSGELKVSNCTMKAVANSKGIVGATSVENTDIELVKDGAVASGDYIIDYSTTYRLKRVIGCRLRGRLWIKKDYAVVQGVIIESDNIGNNAITVAANGVVVTGCVIVTKANNAISETSGYDCNIFANNICRRSIVKTGAHSVSVNNVDLDDMTATA